MLLSNSLVVALALAGTGVKLTPVGQTQVSGGLDAAAVRKVLEAHHAELEACILREMLRGAEAQGRVVLSFEVLADGTATKARVEPLPGVTSNPAIAACLVRQLGRWRFPPPTGGAATVRHVMVFHTSESTREMADPNRSALPHPAAPPPEPCRVVSGRVDIAAVMALLLEHGPDVAKCVALAPAPAPVDAGSLSLFVGLGPRPAAHPAATWTITPSGAVSGLTFEQSGVRATQVERCLAAAMRSWAFPRPDETAVVSCALSPLAFTSTSGGTRCPKDSKRVGAVCQLGNGKEGSWALFSPEGAPLEQGHFVKGLRSGTWVSWYSAQQGAAPAEREVVTWRDGVRDGPWESFRPVGAPLAEGRYVKGVPFGDWRTFHPNGALESVTEHADGGLVVQVTRYDELGERLSVESADGGQRTRFAFDEPLAEDAGSPPVCQRLTAKQLPPPGFAVGATQVHAQLVGTELVVVAAGSSGGLDARIFDPRQGQWLTAAGAPRTSERVFGVDARALDDRRLVIWQPGSARAYALDVAARAWRDVPEAERGLELRVVGQRCVYAWPRSPGQGWAWCWADLRWSPLHAPSPFDTAEAIVSTSGDGLLAIAAVDGGAPQRRWRAAAYSAGAKAWSESGVPGAFDRPHLFTTQGGATLVELGFRGGDGEARGAVYDAADGGWTALAIRGTAKAVLTVLSEQPALLSVTGLSSPLLFDGAHRRWAAVPLGRQDWPHLLWSGGRLRPLGTLTLTPTSWLSVLDWSSRTWCRTFLDDASLRVPAQSLYRVYVGDSALAIWGRDDVVELPCPAVVCPQRPRRESHADVGVFATWGAQ